MPNPSNTLKLFSVIRFKALGEWKIPYADASRTSHYSLPSILSVLRSVRLEVSVAELLANGCHPHRKNPRPKEDITHLPPEHVAASILEKERRIAEILENIKG